MIGSFISKEAVQDFRNCILFEIANREKYADATSWMGMSTALGMNRLNLDRDYLEVILTGADRSGS